MDDQQESQTARMPDNPEYRPLHDYEQMAIRKRMVDLNLSQSDLAKKAHLSKTEVTRILNGTRAPRISTLLKLSVGLDFEDIDDFYAFLIETGKEAKEFHFWRNRSRLPRPVAIPVIIGNDTVNIFHDGFVFVLQEEAFGRDLYALQVGNNLSAPGFRDGDIIIADFATNPQKGDLVVVWGDGYFNVATVERYEAPRSENSHAEGQNMPSREMKRLRVGTCGVVFKSIRNYYLSERQRHVHKMRKILDRDLDLQLKREERDEERDQETDVAPGLGTNFTSGQASLTEDWEVC